jgi:hypothetical protein
MRPADQQLLERWNEIVGPIDAAGIPRDELSVLAIVAGAELFTGLLTRRRVRETRLIGFAPLPRKETL